MDDYLRQLERRFRKFGSKEAEVDYLRALRRINRITDERLEKAAYFGSEAANEIVPYDTPYEIARLMPGARTPEPPQTSWFCDDIYKNKNMHDIADIWCQVDLIGTDLDFEETSYEIALIMNMLILYFVVQTNITHPDDIGVWWEPIAITYNKMRESMITGEILAPEQSTLPSTSWVGVLWELIRGYLGDPTVDLDIPLDLRWLSEELVGLLPLPNSQQQSVIIGHEYRKQMCDFVSDKLRRYLLGYDTLAETLPKIHRQEVRGSAIRVQRNPDESFREAERRYRQAGDNYEDYVNALVRAGILGRLHSEAQIERMRNLLASAPLYWTPVDDELQQLGWVEVWDDDSKWAEIWNEDQEKYEKSPAAAPTDLATQHFYRPDGSFNRLWYQSY